MTAQIKAGQHDMDKKSFSFQSSYYWTIFVFDKDHLAKLPISTLNSRIWILSFRQHNFDEWSKMYLNSFLNSCQNYQNMLFKVWTFWEAHKIWKNVPLKIWRYSVASNFKWNLFFQNLLLLRRIIKIRLFDIEKWLWKSELCYIWPSISNGTKYIEPSYGLFCDIA